MRKGDFRSEICAHIRNDIGYQRIFNSVLRQLGKRLVVLRASYQMYQQKLDIVLNYLLRGKMSVVVLSYQLRIVEHTKLVLKAEFCLPQYREKRARHVYVGWYDTVGHTV